MRHNSFVAPEEAIRVPHPPDTSADGQAAPHESDHADRIEPNRDNRVSTRPLVLGIVAVVLAFAIVAVLLQAFAAERAPELTEAQLAAAEELWEQKGPASYDMDLEIRGARPGAVHIEVHDGQPTAMTRDGRSPPQRTWDVWSVPGQFDTLQRELELAEDPQHEMNVKAGARLQLRCEFDAEFGYPRRYHRYATGGAPEVFWRVTKFEPK
jgi:hypothetical protein